MNNDQKTELDRFQARLNEQGERLDKGSIPWLLFEVLENLRRLEELLSSKHDRPSKKRLKPILWDIRDQINELRKRLD